MQFCFGVDSRELNQTIYTRSCHKDQGSQYFRYDLVTFQIRQGHYRSNSCIDADFESQTVFTSKCDPEKMTQKWKFGFVNETNVHNWLSYGTAIKDEQEILDLRKIELWKFSQN